MRFLNVIKVLFMGVCLMLTMPAIAISAIEYGAKMSGHFIDAERMDSIVIGTDESDSGLLRWGLYLLNNDESEKTEIIPHDELSDGANCKTPKIC